MQKNIWKLTRLFGDKFIFSRLSSFTREKVLFLLFYFDVLHGAGVRLFPVESCYCYVKPIKTTPPSFPVLDKIEKHVHFIKICWKEPIVWVENESIGTFSYTLTTRNFEEGGKGEGEVKLEKLYWTARWNFRSRLCV